MKKKKQQLKIKSLKFLILVFSFSFFFFTFNNVEAALLYLDPSEGEYGPGDTFIVKLRVDNEEECINAAEVHLRFPVGLLRAVDFSRGGSIFSLWIKEPTINNKEGIISFSGGIPAGYCGRIKGDPALSNILGKVIFNVLAEVRDYKETQFVTIEILPNSQVLLNDGLGTQAKLFFEKSEFLINPFLSPSKSEWLNELREDKIPPEAFKVRIRRNEDVYRGKYFLVFSTTDKQSGMDRFEILEKEQWKRVESPYLLKNRQLPEEIKIRAIDKAGNERLGEYVIENIVPLPQKSKIAYSIFFIFIAIGVTIAVVSHKLKNSPFSNWTNNRESEK